MKCPTCNSPRDMAEIEQNTLWCPNCGTITDREQDGGDVPAQAKSHAALRAFVEEYVAGHPCCCRWVSVTGGEKPCMRCQADAALDAAPE